MIFFYFESTPKEYSYLRHGINLQDNKELCNYIQKVVKLREKQEENKSNRTKQNTDDQGDGKVAS